MLCSFAAALALAAVCGFGWYGYTACDRVSFFDARLQAYYQQAENGANGWVLETRAEDVYLKPTHADWHYEAIRYRIPWVHDTLDKLLKKDTDLLRSTGWMRTDHSAVVDAADKGFCKGRSGWNEVYNRWNAFQLYYFHRGNNQVWHISHDNYSS